MFGLSGIMRRSRVPLIVYALEFDGVDDYVDIPDDFGLFGGDMDYTIEFWFNQYSGGTQYFFSPYGENSFRIQTGFDQPDDVINVRGQVEGTWTDIVVASSHNYNTWLHCALTYNTTEGYKLYIDGVEEDSDAETGSIDSRNQNNALGGMSGDNTVDGMMNDVRIWSATRTQQQIQDNMHKRLEGNESGLVGYWPMNEGEGSTVYDKSTNNNDGTIHGAMWVEKEK